MPNSPYSKILKYRNLFDRIINEFYLSSPEDTSFASFKERGRERGRERNVDAREKHGPAASGSPSELGNRSAHREFPGCHRSRA